MKVVLIKYHPLYEDYEEIVGIAINMEMANKHIQHLKKRCPHAYEYDDNRFDFDEYEVIER